MIEKDAFLRLFNEAMELLNRVNALLDGAQSRLEKVVSESIKEAA